MQDLSPKPSTCLRDLLPYGSISVIAEKLKINRNNVSKALSKGKPSSRVVIEAMRIARESGALDAAKDLASLNQ